MTDPSNRRLAAILAADVVGYSRLVSVDEEGTIRALRAVRTTVIEPAIEPHGGRIANTAGDSFVIEFRSAVDAVRAALKIQSDLGERSDELAGIQLRVGINVGDVISNGSDILGDGVNVAARLEALAEAGGIVVSRAAADYARGNVTARFDPMGPQRLKNIAEPVETFRIAEPGDLPTSASKTKRWRVPLLAVAGTLVLALIFAGVWVLQQPETAPRASVERMAFPLPDKPSIAVLPFADRTANGTDLTRADGMTEDLITDLAGISDLFVIAGNTSFAYRDRDIDAAGFAEELGVRYVVEGSLQDSGDMLRVSIRLVDTGTGQLVWAERFNGPPASYFDAQQGYVLQIADRLGLTLDASERDRIAQPETDKLEAREAFQRGWALYSRFNEADNLAAIPHFKSAVDLDPEYARAWGALALAHLRPHIFHHWNAFTDDGGQLHIGLFFTYLREASKRETSLTHVARAMIQLNLRDSIRPSDSPSDRGSAQRQAALAIALQPSDPEAHVTMGWALVSAGNPREGLSFIEAAMRLDPEFPSHYVLLKAAALFALDDLEGAQSALSDGLERDPRARELMPVAASLLALAGDRRAARAMIERWWEGRSSAALDAAVADYFFIVRWSGDQKQLNNRLMNGLRLAALPPDVNVVSLQSNLRRGDASSQRKAARALGLFGAAAAAAVPELIAALDSPSTFVRKEAAIALGRIGPPARDALPALRARQGDTLVGAVAARAIEEIEAATE